MYKRREKVSAAAHMTSHVVEECVVVQERNENRNITPFLS